MISVIITLDESCLSDPQEAQRVLASCAEQGFKLSRQLSNIGVLCGTTADSRVEALKQIPGVCSVEPDEQRFAL